LLLAAVKSTILLASAGDQVRFALTLLEKCAVSLSKQANRQAGYLDLWAWSSLSPTSGKERKKRGERKKAFAKKTSCAGLNLSLYFIFT
jgi:hypothetical protein